MNQRIGRAANPSAANGDDILCGRIGTSGNHEKLGKQSSRG